MRLWKHLYTALRIRTNSRSKGKIKPCGTPWPRVERLEERLAPVVGANSIPAPVLPGGLSGHPLEYDGVVALVDAQGNPFCTGSLLFTGRHVLTAAHCVDLDVDTDGDGNPDRGDGVVDGPIVVRFELNRGRIQRNVRLTVPTEHVTLGRTVTGRWNGDIGNGHDIAVIRLTDQAPGQQLANRHVVAPFPAHRFDINRTNNEVDKDFDFAGYGNTGTGASGEVPRTLGVKRSGKNTFSADATRYMISGKGHLGLVADFDNPDRGGIDTLRDGRHRGNDEAAAGHGDSGSGILGVGRLIAGITSFGCSPVSCGPFDYKAKFGDVMVFTRVSAFATDFIDPQVSGPYHLVLDMNQQVLGKDEIRENLTIAVRRVGNSVELVVDGSADERFNGQYYTAPLSEIQGLTIRCSNKPNPDRETIRIEGDLGFQPTIECGKAAMLVLDQSGSMIFDPDTGLPRDRLDFAKRSAKIFTRFVSLGDQLGVGSFSDQATVDFPLTRIVDARTRELAGQAIDSLVGGGSTNIGGGLQVGLNQLIGQPFRQNIMVLLSDGDHNTGTHPNVIIPALKAVGVTVHTIGVGTDISPEGQELLQRIARETGGEFLRVSGAFGQIGLFLRLALERLLGNGLLAGRAETIASNEVKRTPVLVEIGANSATFSLALADSRDRLSLSLRSPSGRIISPDDVGRDPNIDFIDDPNNKSFRITTPEAGTWEMVVSAGTVTDGRIELLAFGFQEGVRLLVEAENRTPVFPRSIFVRATPQFGGQNVIGATVTGTVIRPSGSRVPITLFDDGNFGLNGDAVAGDGVYSARFTDYESGGNGTYTFELAVTSPRAPVPPFTRIATTTAVATGVPANVEPFLYVTATYRTVVQRVPEPAELNSWVDLLRSGVPRHQVAQAFWQSPEHRGVQVEGLYRQYLRRSADAAERAAWVSALVGGLSEVEVTVAFVTSAEYVATHNDTSKFVSGLYADVLSRTPDPLGQEFWRRVVERGESRAVVARAFRTSFEAYVTDLDRFYAEYLGRPADVGGQLDWLLALQNGQVTLAAVEQAFLASEEFFARARRRAN